MLFVRSVQQRVDDVGGRAPDGEAAAALEGVRVGAEVTLEPIVPGENDLPFVDDVRAILPRATETWVGTTGGLRVVGPEAETERLYTARSGLLRSDVTALAAQGETVAVAHPEEGLSL